MTSLIDKLRDGVDLSPIDIDDAVALVLAENAPAAEKAALLTALHKKGESAEEIVGFVEQLTRRAIDPMLDPAKLPGPMIDVCGTGGAGLDLFNVSTTIMFILAAGGAAVVKHGNRSVTSSCGSADVLEALGIPLEWQPDRLKDCLERFGLCFVFARQYHPAFRALADMRAQLARAGTRTIFNLLGPLLNPARPPRQLIGVYSPRLTTIFAEVLRQLGRERAWIVHGYAEDGAGMDDISIGGVTALAELDNRRVTSGVLDCRWLGICEGAVAELRGGNAAQNARTLQAVLNGEEQGAKRNLAIVNAAGGFVVAGLADDMRQGIALAREQIDSGRALGKLHALQKFAP